MVKDHGEEEARETAAREIARLLVTPSDLQDGPMKMLRDTLVQKRASEELRMRGLQSSRLDQASMGYILGRNCSLWSQLLRKYEVVDEILGNSKVGVALRNESVKRVNRALWNVNSVLFLMKFYEDLAGEITALTDALNAASDPELYNIHVKLVSLERMRELAALDASSLVNEGNHFRSMFHPLLKVRAVLESRLWSIIRGVRVVATTNAGSVVAAMRIVEAEEAEDRWWKEYAASVNREQEAMALRPVRNAKARTLLEIRVGIRNRIGAAFAAQDSEEEGSDAMIRSNLRVASELLKDLETVKTFVNPCFPPEYELDRLFIRDYNEHLMKRLSGLLNSSAQLSDGSYVRIINWYAEYRMKLQEAENREEDIELKLSEKDREKLALYYQQYLKEVMTRMVEKLISALQSGNANNFITVQKGRSYTATKGPDDLFGLVRFQIREVALLSDGEVLSEHTESIAATLISYADRVMGILDATGPNKPSIELMSAVTNDSSRCLEYAEELKELLYRLLEERFHDKVDKFEFVLDAFHSLERKAKDVILQSMFEDIRGTVNKLFQRSTGTEIVLDIVQTLQDYLGELKLTLIDHHSREIALSSMERLVDGYLSAFSVSESRTDNNGAAVFVQINKDMANLEEFFSQYVKKHLFDARIAPLVALRHLFVCLPSVGAVRDAYADITELWISCSPDIVERVLRMRPEIDKHTYNECVYACSSLSIERQPCNNAEDASKGGVYVDDRQRISPTKRRPKQQLEWRMGLRGQPQQS